MPATKEPTSNPGEGQKSKFGIGSPNTVRGIIRPGRPPLCCCCTACAGGCGASISKEKK